MITLMMVAVLALSMLAGCGSTKTAGSVATDGSTSMEKVIGALGEAFQNDTGIHFTYNPTGSGSGIKAVQEGRCDIGLSSRDLKDEEKAAGLTGTVLAYDGIAIIVHPENPVGDLSLETIAKIESVLGEDIISVKKYRKPVDGYTQNPEEKRKYLSDNRKKYGKKK